jgi:hypothetical protein
MTPDEQNTPQPLNRRAFLGRTLAIGAAGLGVTTVLAACGDSAAGNSATDEAVDSSACAGYDALSETDLNSRQALGYVDRTPNEEQICANCRFKAAYEQDASCIGCTLFAGPVSPGGYCTGWAAAV